VARSARVSLLAVLRRWVLAAPFLAMVPLIAVVAEGERRGVGPLTVSVAGAWAAWNVAAKGLLGLTTTVLLVATTRTSDLVTGLDRLRVPPVFSATAGFMLRYLQTVADDARRLRLARLARGDDPRWIWQARGVAATAGTLFVRTFERGERVHRCMVARGYAGRLPPSSGPAAVGQWALGACLPIAGALVAGAAWLVER
jgi:cobalt/nickel transport system permease protein